MTRIEVHIDRLVLRGVPAEFAEGLGPLIEQRLSELATADRRGDAAPLQPEPRTRRERPAADRETLATRVARDVWAAAKPHLQTGAQR